MNLPEIGYFLLEILSKFGIFGVCIFILVILFLFFGAKFATTKGEQLGKANIWKFFQERTNIDVKIRELLTELINNTTIDRTAVVEYHNGSYNLTGLPFMGCKLTFVKNRLGMDELSTDLDETPTSTIPELLQMIHKNTIVEIKNLKDLHPLFPRLYKEMKEDGITSILFHGLEGVKGEIGFIMVASKSPINFNDIKGILEKKVQQISILLDYQNVK